MRKAIPVITNSIASPMVKYSGLEDEYASRNCMVGYICRLYWQVEDWNSAKSVWTSKCSNLGSCRSVFARKVAFGPSTTKLMVCPQEFCSTARTPTTCCGSRSEKYRSHGSIPIANAEMSYCCSSKELRIGNITMD